MKKLLGPTLCKLLQRQTYTCLSSRYGIWLCIGGLLLTFISAFQFGEVVLEWSMQKYAVTFNAYHDNVAGKTFQDRLCLPIPIDVVYTWVNGSDPRLIAALQKLKLDMESQKNKTRALELLELKANSSSKAVFNKKKKKAKKDTGFRGACPFADCVKSFSLIVQGLPDNTSLGKIQLLGKAFKKASKAYSLSCSGSIKEKVTVIQFSNEVDAKDALKEEVNWQGKNLNTTEGFFTSDSTRPSAVRSDTEVMILDVKTSVDLDELRKDLGERFGEKLLLGIKYHIASHVAVAYFSEKSAAVSALNIKLTLKGKTLKMLPAMHIWTPFSTTKDGTIKDEEEDADMSASRFADNQELKYSLRSIEKHAPWVRKIFIVTNGQIPSWLNLDNPRIQIITHAELFPNASHLPTFSSPAIESHLHRIPGVSQKFIYMNDDVLFAEDVWPDDFYTHSKGQKIFLTWSVPNCNEGCPSSWINDKYCDKACNVSVCDWDGGDCLGVRKQSSWSYQGWRTHQSGFRLEFCSSGCADTWVGDRYCDVACNNPSCGFDAGDCGPQDMSKLYSVDIDRTSELIFLPRGLKAMYFNLSSVFVEGKITSGDHSEAEVVRSATIAQKHKILTLTLRRNISLSTIEFRVEGFTDKNGTKAAKLKFNITVDTRPGKAGQPTVRQPDVKRTFHVNSTATTPMPGNASKPPRTIYPVRIHHSETILNYWVLGNESIAKPTWIVDDGEYIIPEVANNTVLPEDVKRALEAIEQEFKDGDLTEKGYARRKAKILEEYLDTTGVNGCINFTPNPNEVPIVALTAPLDFSLQTPTQAATLAARNPRKGEETIDNKGGNSHARKLLWADQTHREPNAITAAPQPPPTDDEIFVADWISNSKQKQLSLAKDQENDNREWQERYGDWSPIANPGATSFLPWERLGIFEPLQKALEQQHRAAQYDTQEGHHHSRKLMDTFADSLLHVHRIYNRKFGYIARKVPAHMPHMIDVQIMNELQATFADEFDKTSSHKLRSSDDMQFAFSYMYFVVGQKKAVNVTEMFAELDTDHSGYLSDRELRTLATRLYKLPLDQRDLKSLKETLRNCSTAENITRPQDKDFLPMISETFLNQCDKIVEMLDSHGKDGHKYKYETLSDEDVAFHMIRDNATKVLQQLDVIRSKKKKFVCLNDNIDHSKEDARLIKALLVDFYESLFPIPSQFELPNKYRNRFLHTSDVKKWVEQRNLTRFWVNIFIGSVLVIAFFAMFSGVITWIVQAFCPFRRGQAASSRLLTV